MTDLKDPSCPKDTNNFQEFCKIPNLSESTFSEISTNFFVDGLNLSSYIPFSTHPLKLYLLTLGDEEDLPDVDITMTQVCEELFLKVFNKTFCEEKTKEEIVGIIQNPLPTENNLHIDLCHTILSMLPESLQKKGEIMYDDGKEITQIITHLVKNAPIQIDSNPDMPIENTDIPPIDRFFSKFLPAALDRYSKLLGKSKKEQKDTLPPNLSQYNAIFP